MVQDLSEKERSYPPPKPAELRTIRSLGSDTKDPVRIMCFVIEAQTGVALVQDIYDNVDEATTIKVFVEGTLQVDNKYILIGTVTEKSTKDGSELVFNSTLAHNIDKLEIKLYKEALEMEGAVLQALDQ